MCEMADRAWMPREPAANPGMLVHGIVVGVSTAVSTVGAEEADEVLVPVTLNAMAVQALEGEFGGMALSAKNPRWGETADMPLVAIDLLARIVVAWDRRLHWS